MRLFYALLLSVSLVAGLSGQAMMDNCNDATATGINDFFDVITDDQPYSVGVNRSYCVKSNAPLVVGKLGAISFSSDITYPFTIRVTDLSNGQDTTLTNFQDSVTIINDRFYFVEVMPTAIGEGGIGINPNFANPFIALLAQRDTADIRVVDATMPVTWARPLSYRINGKNLNFDWSVTDQINVSGYILERADGNDWTVVSDQRARTDGAAELSYAAADAHGQTAAAYRIRQTDYDGRFSFSNIVMVPAADRVRELSVYPNPAGETVSFLHSVPVAAVRLLNLAGQPLRSLEGPGTRGSLSLAGLPAGIYLLEVSDTSGNRETRRVLRR